MPRPSHPRPCHSSQGHGTACLLREDLWASSGYHVESQEVVIRRIPISDAGGHSETKHRLSWTRKRVVAAQYKEDDLLHCWTSSRIFPATMRTFTKDTHCPSRAGARLGMCELTHGMAGERHGRGMETACYVWIGIYWTATVRCPLLTFSHLNLSPYNPSYLSPTVPERTLRARP